MKAPQDQNATPIWAALAGLIVALPWVIAVELTPPDQRPYVGGSTSNSVLDLAFGYNALARLWGEDWSYYLGTPGPLRFFNDKLAGQVSWLLPFAIAGLLAVIWQARQGSASRQRPALILWSSWLMFPLLYFSVSQFYHRYYLASLAPAVAALVGIGATAIWRIWQSAGWRKGLVLLTLLGNAGIQLNILAPFPDWSRWLTPLVGGLCLAAVGVLLVAWRTERFGLRRFAQPAFTTAILALLIAPAVWAAIPVTTCTHTTLPTGGPQARKCKPFETKPFLDPELVTYLEEHRDGARFLAATYDMGIACLGILETGEPFMALGGYRGSDPILTADQFAQRVADGEVRFFVSLTEVSEEFPQQEEIKQWVKAHCPTAPIESAGVEVRGPCEAQPGHLSSSETPQMPGVFDNFVPYNELREKAHRWNRETLGNCQAMGRSRSKLIPVIRLRYQPIEEGEKAIEIQNPCPISPTRVAPGVDGVRRKSDV